MWSPPIVTCLTTQLHWTFHTGAMWLQLQRLASTAPCCILLFHTFAVGSVSTHSVAHDAVMRREKLPVSATSRDFEEDGPRSSGSLASSSFLFSGMDARARQSLKSSHGLDDLANWQEAQCSAYNCGMGKLLKPEADRPEHCAVSTQCTEQECCVGTCEGFWCPTGTSRVDDVNMPEACKGFTCTAEECCLGTCANHTCPPNSQEKPAALQPAICNSYGCDPNECCYGECPGITCPAGTSFKDPEDQPNLCNYYPCRHSECCKSQCTEELCQPDGPNAPGARVLIPGAANLTCTNYPCAASECCLGRCGEESICRATAPLDPDRWPNPCIGYHCTREECCVGHCSAHSCAHIPHKEPRTDIGQCADRSCTDEECCLGTCSDDMCPTEFGLVPKDDASLPSRCQSYNCTTEECCNGICTHATCPASGGFSLKSQLPANCGTYACTEAECCDGICTAGTCPVNAGLKLKDNPPSVCEGDTCKYEECCEHLALCSAHVCENNKVIDPLGPIYCNDTVCTSSQCCTDPGTCHASVCTSFNSVEKPYASRPASCVNATCDEDECCEKAKHIYWIEKTAGVIRRCRYDDCTHDTVEDVKNHLLLPEGITFAEGKLYFTDTNRNKIFRCVPSNCDSQTELMTSDVQEPVRLAVDNSTKLLYWTERVTNKIFRCDITTVPCTKSLVVAETAVTGSYYGLVVDSDNSHLYFTTSNAVYRCDLKALPCTSPTAIATGLTNAGGIAYNTNTQKLYWTCADIVESKSVADSDSGVAQVTSGVDNARGVAVDSTSGTLYLSDSVESGTGSKIRSCDTLECADPTVMVSGCPSVGCLNMPYDIVLDWSR